VNCVKRRKELFTNTYYKTSEYPKIRNAQLFAWPVYSWEVYLSSPKGRSLNLFEKTILELIRVTGGRNLTVAQIAQWLSLEDDMVSYILTATMQPNGWLDKNFKITADGIKLLDSEEIAEMTSALIFQCAVTGKWLPRIAYQFTEVQPVGIDKKLAFKLSRATDRTTRPYRVQHRIKGAQQPGDDMLNDIVTKDSDARWIAFNVRNDIDIPAKSSDKVILSPKSAHAAYLMVWAEQSSGYKFDFIDPFELSNTPTWLDELFNQACNDLPKMGQFALSKFNPENEKLTYAENLKLMQEKARLEVLIEYPNAQRISDLIDPLYELINDKQKLASSNGKDFSLNRGIVTSSGSLIETVCEALLKVYTYKGIHRLPSKNQNDKKEQIEKLLKQAANLSTDQVDTILNVQPDKIYATARGWNTSLRAMLATIFLSMKDYPHHPMKLVLNDRLLFQDIYDLSKKRDQASHKNPPKFSGKQALHYINVVDKFLKTILAD
jgi:hypothetical protein